MSHVWKSSIIIRTMILGSMMALVGSIFNLPVGVGILVGLMFGAMRQWVQEIVLTSILSVRRINYFFFGIYFIGSFGVLAIPLYIGSVYPDFVNVFGAAFGLLLHKLVIYAEELFKKRKER